jgi:hypothetical protein
MDGVNAGLVPVLSSPSDGRSRLIPATPPFEDGRRRDFAFRGAVIGRSEGWNRAGESGVGKGCKKAVAGANRPVAGHPSDPLGR